MSSRRGSWLWSARTGPYGRWPTAWPSLTGWRSRQDNSTLIVAESYGGRLTGFDIGPDGSLSNRRVWADLGEDAAPDGICVDAEDAAWFASVPGKHCVRVAEGGEVLQTIEADRGCFACMLGGPDGRTLFAVGGDLAGRDDRRKPNGSGAHDRGRRPGGRLAALTGEPGNGSVTAS